LHALYSIVLTKMVDDDICVLFSLRLNPVHFTLGDALTVAQIKWCNRRIP